jgi:hypothetical protein
MMRSGWLVRGTAMALCALVSGCGGDGGGTVASVGSPAPPTGVNANLLGTLKSESFANQAAQASLSIANYSSSGSVGQPAGTFIYDASTQSYTMTVGGQSKAFTPSMIQAGVSGSAETVYEATSGSTADSLTLTQAGTSGRFTYEYVGAAFWEHIDSLSAVSSSNGSGTIYAMAYGEPTAAGSVPKTGQGYYGLDLIGVESHGNVALPTAFTGTGAMAVNFGTGAIQLGGTIDGGTSANGFSSTATLSSSGSFAGTIQLNLDTTQQGQLTGRFYGPAAQEVGAVFDTALAQGSGFETTGVILGRQATASESTDSSFNVTSGVDAFTADRVRQPATGAATVGTAQVTVVGLGPSATDVTVALPDYTVTTNVAGGGGQTISNVLNQPAGTTGYEQLISNTDYVRAGVSWDGTGTAPTYDTMVFGYVTPGSGIPLTGFADYAVQLDAIERKSGTTPVEVAGAGYVSIEFASGTMTAGGDLRTVGTNGAALGAWSGTAALDSTSAAFSGAMTIAGGAGYTGTWQGHLYGPGAGEIGALFSQAGSDGSTIVGEMIGTLGGVQQTVVGVLNQPAGTAGFEQLTSNTSYALPGMWWNSTGATPMYDAMVFGDITPASAVPLSGSAGYAVNVDAIEQKGAASPAEVTGTGYVGVEFATGALLTAGNLQTAGTNAAAAVGTWAGTAALGSGTAAFSGTMTVSGGTAYTGTWQGNLYGPAASEIGAVIRQSGTDGSTITGVLTGAQSSTITDPFVTVATATPATAFATSETAYVNLAGVSPEYQASGISPSQVTYDSSTDTYTITGSTAQVNLGFFNRVSAVLNGANRDASNSDATFTAYAAPNLTARVFNSGAANPVIQLSYTSFAEVTQTFTSAGLIQPAAQNHYIVFGLPTNAVAMPTSGSAGYTGVVYGHGGMGTIPDFAVTGTGVLNANFATGALTSTLNLNVTPTGTTNTQPFGNYTMGGTISGNTFTASTTVTPGVGELLQAGIQGTFNGPHAEEVGATWALSIYGGQGAAMAGVFVGKKN